MKFKLQFFRVYGSKFQYASDSRFVTSKNPIKIELPSKEDNLFVVIGKPCKSIFEANNVKLANGMRILNASSYRNNV